MIRGSGPDIRRAGRSGPRVPATRSRSSKSAANGTQGVDGDRERRLDAGTSIGLKDGRGRAHEADYHGALTETRTWRLKKRAAHTTRCCSCTGCWCRVSPEPLWGQRRRACLRQRLDDRRGRPVGVLRGHWPCDRRRGPPSGWRARGGHARYESRAPGRRLNPVIAGLFSWSPRRHRWRVVMSTRLGEWADEIVAACHGCYLAEALMVRPQSSDGPG